MSSSVGPPVPPPLSRWIFFKTRVAVTMVAITVGVTVWSLYDARESIRREAEQQASNLTITISNTIERTVTTLDLSLQAAVSGMKIDGLEAMPPNVQDAILFDGGILANNFRGILITDETGRVIHRSRNASPAIQDFSKQATFQGHKNSTDEGLRISGPLPSMTGDTMVVVLTRRINKPDGSFGGMAITAIGVKYFEDIFTELDLDKRGISMLASTEAHLIARHPMSLGVNGRDLSGGEIFTHFATKPSGSFDSPARLDGIRRLFNYRQVANLPLVVSVGLATDDIYASWVHRAWIMGGVLTVMVSLYLYLSRSLEHEIRQRSRAEGEARATQAEAEQLTKDMAEALAKRDALFENTTDSMVIIRVNASGEHVYDAVNPVWERLTGLNGANVIGRTIRECLPKQIADKVEPAWLEASRTWRPAHQSYSANWKGNEPTHWESIVCPVFSKDGKIFRLIGVSRDVTAQKRLQEKLREAHRMEAVSELTAGIAHDFNNLLQAIMASLELLGDRQGLDEEDRLTIGIADDAAKQGASLVRSLLAFSRKQRLDPTLLHPKSASVQFATIMRAALGGEHTLEVHVADDAWPVMVDQDQLSQSLVNLTMNARDATPNGGTVHLHITAAGPEQASAAGVTPGRYTCFTLTDEGKGIPPKLQSRVFEPFFTTKEIGKGTGLGLPMVQGFARQSGGDVTLESTLGIGTSVTFWLPCAAIHAMRTLTAAETPPKDTVRMLRVLLVDDSTSVREPLCMFLRRAGYDAVGVASAEEALTLLRQEPKFNLLVTDQSMPSMSGTELIEQATLLQPNLPTMLITGFDRVSGIERLKGRVTVMNKPFDGRSFVRQVAALLETEADHKSSSEAAPATAGNQNVYRLRP